MLMHGDYWDHDIYFEVRNGSRESSTVYLTSCLSVHEVFIYGPDSLQSRARAVPATSCLAECSWSSTWDRSITSSPPLSCPMMESDSNFCQGYTRAAEVAGHFMEGINNWKYSISFLQRSKVCFCTLSCAISLGSRKHRATPQLQIPCTSAIVASGDCVPAETDADNWQICPQEILVHEYKMAYIGQKHCDKKEIWGWVKCYFSAGLQIKKKNGNVLCMLHK